MTATVNVHEAKTHFSKLLERAHAGEEIILAKAGKPYARLVPIEAAPKPERKPGRFPELASIPDSVWFDPLPDDELDLWEGKHKDYS
ncbi:MAG: type II toxin-antitoxin system Phd/YefM family antitoxin [Sphingomonas sp.]